jgi:hypothetical protein
VIVKISTDVAEIMGGYHEEVFMNALELAGASSVVFAVPEGERPSRSYRLMIDGIRSVGRLTSA